MNKPEINPYEPPQSSLATDDASEAVLYTRELYDKTLTFKGRMGRIRYLYTTLGGITMALCMVVFWSKIYPALGGLAAIYYAVKMPWVCAASSVRRVHDMGKTGDWAWFALFPPALIWLALAPGQDKVNDYGDIVFRPTTWEHVGVFFTLMIFALLVMLLPSFL